MSKFWDVVEKCEHKNIYPDYCESINCATEYCRGTEIHCMDCKAYIGECGCGSNTGKSGWSQARHKVESRRVKK